MYYFFERMMNSGIVALHFEEETIGIVMNSTPLKLISLIVQSIAENIDLYTLVVILFVHNWTLVSLIRKDGSRLRCPFVVVLLFSGWV